MIWGSAFLLTDVLVEDVAPATIVAGRLLIATAVLGAIVLVTRRGAPARGMWPLLALLGLTNNLLPFTLITWAQQHITSSLAGTLNATMPMITFVVAVALASERMEPVRALGLLVGFAGAAVLIGPDLSDITSSNALAELAVIGGSTGYGVSTVLARRGLHGDSISLGAAQNAVAACYAVPFALLVDWPVSISAGPREATAWIALGVFSSGVAYIIYFTLVQRVSATSVAVVSYLIPVVATLLGWWVLDESVGANLIVGLVLIVGGMVAVNGSVRFNRQRAPAPA